MSRTTVDWLIEHQIERMFDKVWQSAERGGVSWEDVNQAFLNYDIAGFDEWWEAGED